MFSSLPINAVLPEICAVLERRHELVLEAPPGAGKTTAVPLALLGASWRKNDRILVLEPRRVAARAAAERMAQLLGENVGERVGYRIRMESRVSSQTVIEVVTEGILTRMLQDNPALEGIAAVLFDEIHERSIHSDLALALCLQGRAIFRESPLKLVAMSATLDASALAQLMDDAPVISSEGRCFPVEVNYGRSQKVSEFNAGVVAQHVCDALHRHNGNALVFLPGQREINTVLNELKKQPLADVEIFPLYGSLPFSEQQKALVPLSRGRKLVLATDIAETSLTIDGVTIVVDTGLCRTPRFDPRTGLTRLHTERVSKASATQRAGRAGRLSAGVCYRLWSEDQQSQLAAQTAPEILQADLLPLALQLLQWGVNDVSELRWVDTPPAAAIQQAEDLLLALGAMAISTTGNKQLTAHGQALAALPLHPRLAHMLLMSAEQGAAETAANLASLVVERCPLTGVGVDLLPKLQILQGTVSCPPIHRGWLRRAQAQAKQYRRLSADHENSNTRVPAGVLLAYAYPDRIAQRRANARNVYLLSNGRSVTLWENDALAGANYLVVAETGGAPGQREDKIFAALEIGAADFDEWLSPLIRNKRVMEWREGKLVAQQQRSVGAIVLESKALTNLRQADIQQAAMAYVREQGIAILPWTDTLRQWQQRVHLLSTVFPNHDPKWPEVSDHSLLETLENWLLPYVGAVRKTADFKRLPLYEMLQSLLPWPLPKLLESLAPTHLTVPSGSNIAIDYSQTPPVLEVKLQEMFGCRQTPAIGDGKVALMVHLLSPARRPLQITQDLEGFWNGSYQDVKKEMKGRYPKHPWPDDPWNSAPTRYTTRRLNKPTT